jgi:hypothetical protein
MGRQLCSQGRERPPAKVLSCHSRLFNPPEFIPAEAMGTEVPRRCPPCRNCKECQFRMDSLTFKEKAEYEVMLSKLHLDVDRKGWVAGYPFNTMVDRLIDNYNQACGAHEQDGVPTPIEREAERVQSAIPGQCGQGSIQASPQREGRSKRRQISTRVR